MIILDVLFSVNTGNIGLALQKYWTRLRLVQYFCKARPIFPCINLKAIQYYIIIIHTEDFRAQIEVLFCRNAMHFITFDLVTKFVELA